ncbi:MAG TPA: hypothetical protein VHQ70_02460, partial [Syntrophomonadaceae bacterium]|nr:hypothetical protein [Syntrophomonadaceae bacterium]
MKKGWSLAIFLLVGMLQLVFITPDYTRANGQSNPSFTGTYLVQIKTSSGDDYSAKIGIEDLGDDKIKLSGNFDGMPLTAIGKRSEEKSDTSGYIFKTNIPKLYNGTAVMDLRYEDNQYKLSGSGKGTYQYQGFSGQSSFKITGHRTSP